MSGRLLLRRLHRRTPQAALSFLLLACSGGGEKGAGPVTPPTPAPVASVSVSLASGTVTAGGTTQATATTRDAQGNTLTGRVVTWSSNNTGVATVASTGLVTAVTAGSASITATSEGQSGSASLTVQPDPASQLSLSIGAITQDGQPVDLMKASGTITIAVDQNVPPGFVGTMTFSEGSKILAQDSVKGTAVSARVSSVVTGASYTLPLHSVTTVSNAQLGTIEVTPNLPNTLHTIVGQLQGVIGMVPVQVQKSFQLTTSHPNTFVAFVSPTGPAIPGAGGKQYYVDGISVAVAPVVFDQPSYANIQSVEVVLGPYATQYGAATGGAVNITRRVAKGDFGKPFAFSEVDALLESDPLTGSALRLGEILTNSGSVFPFQTPGVLFGTCFDPSGGGIDVDWATGAPLVGGCTRQLDLPVTQVTHAGAAYRPHRLGMYLDWDFPRVLPGAVQLPRRELLAGLPASAAQGSFGYYDSNVNRSLDLTTLTNAAKLFDVTLDLSATRWYLQNTGNTQNQFALQNEVTSLSAAPITGSARTLTLGVRYCDKKARCTNAFLTTDATNPWKVGGGVSLAANYGVDAMNFATYDTPPSASVTGPSDYTVLNSTYAGSFAYDVTATSGLGALGNNWFAASVKFNNTWIVGRDLDDPDWVASSGNTLSWPLFQLQQKAQQMTGSMDGIYQIYPYVVDRYGNKAPGSTDMPWAFVHDGQNPTVTSFNVTGNLAPGGTADWSVGWADNVSGKRVCVGALINYADASEQPFGKPPVYLDCKSVNPTFPSSWATGGLALGSFQIPQGYYVASSTGAVPSAPVGSTGFVAIVEDYAGRASDVAFLATPIAAGTPTGVVPTTYFSAVSVPTVSTGSSLNSGATPTSFKVYADLLGSHAGGALSVQYRPANGAGPSRPLIGAQDPTSTVGPYTRYAFAAQGRALFPFPSTVWHNAIIQLGTGFFLRGPVVTNLVLLLMYMQALPWYDPA